MGRRGVSLIIFVLLLALVIGGGIYAWQQNKVSEPEVEEDKEVESPEDTEEEKEEAETKSVFNNWPTKQEQDFSFSYPEEVDGNFVNIPSQGWPPRVIVKEAETKQLICEPDETEVILNGHEYCFSSFLEGVAGKEYERYSYRTIRSGKRIGLIFTLAFPTCGALEQIEECEQTQEEFEPHDLAAKILKSLYQSF